MSPRAETGRAALRTAARRVRLVLLCAVLLGARSAAAQTCAGDCNDDGVTSPAEVGLAVEIALLRQPLEQCAAANRDELAAVTVEELVAATGASLGPCGLPTPSPPAAPTPTVTPDELTLAQKVVGPTQGAAAFFLSLPRAFALIAGRLGPAGAGPATCPAGGTFGITCGREGEVDAPVYHVFAEDCALEEESQSVRIAGTMRFTGPLGVACFDGAAASFDMLVSFLRFDIEGETGLLVTSGEDLTGTFARGEVVDRCATGSIDLLTSGEATLDARSQPRHALNGAAFRFDALQLHTDIDEQGAACTLKRFTTTIDGGLALRTGNNVFAAFYQSFSLATQIAAGEAAVTVSGGFVSDCFGAAVAMATVEAARLREGDACFRGGQVDLLHDEVGDRVRYTGIGGVDIDLGRDGELDQRFPTCVAPELYVCPGG